MNTQLSEPLIILGQYLTGVFENREQAISSPVWYVHLRLWLRQVSLFPEDSITLFAEQASIVNLDQPYRPRLLRLRQINLEPLSIQVEHYMFKDIKTIQGAGTNPELLEKLTPEQVEYLTAPGCILKVNMEKLSPNNYQFQAFSAANTPCCFTYQQQKYQVVLGFEVNSHQLKTYDQGIDPKTGKGIWGALMGPYCFEKSKISP